MSVPSSNLLKQAMTAFHSDPVTYFKYNSRDVNAIGTYITTFDAPVTLSICSVQAVRRTVYHQLGLDLQKNYIQVFLPNDIIDIARDVTGDELEWNGRRWQCLSNMPWFAIDGWVNVLCVDIGASNEPPTGFGASFGLFGD